MKITIEIRIDDSTLLAALQAVIDQLAATNRTEDIDGYNAQIDSYNASIDSYNGDIDKTAVQL